MLYLDHLAHHNRFAAVSMAEKLLLGAGVLLISIVLGKTLVFMATVILMNGIILAARTPFGYLARLWLTPLGFLTASLLTVITSISPEPFPAVYRVALGNWQVGVTAESLDTAEQLLWRSMAAVSCLFMIAATTPVAHLVAWLSQFAPLRPVMEIALLTYRFLFVILQTAGQIYTAQQSRLGYHNWQRSLAAMSLLAASIGRKAFLTARELSVTLTARNYTDRLVYRYPPQQLCRWRLAAITFVLVLMIAVGLL